MARGNFFSELKRRNVYRVGVAYAVATFMLLEVVSNAAPFLDLPLWVGRGLILVLMAGFPAALCFAWAYEITPDGLRRTEAVEQDASMTHRTAHRLNVIIIALMLVLAGLFGADHFLPARPTADAVRPETPQNVAAGVSIAVLPFVNLSGDPGQEFFSDGMTEEITSALAKVKGLQVVGRTSAFEFKGQNKDLNAIGKALRATHLLEGSVRKSGSRVRITGQLIRADTGTHLWTENYDRELTDIFKTQDDIARAIASALQVPLGLKQGEALVADRDISPENYQQFLRAKALYRSRGNINLDAELEAVKLLEPLVAAEPGYAPAWSLLAMAYRRSPQNSAAFKQGRPDQREELRKIVEAAAAKARAAAERAIALDPRSAEGYVGLGLSQGIEQLRNREDLLQKALELEPSNPDVLHDVSIRLAEVGRLKEAVAIRHKLLEIEPLVPIFNKVTADILFLDGQNDAALALAKALPLANRNRAGLLAVIYASTGRYAEAADAILTAPQDPSVPAGARESMAQVLRNLPAKKTSGGSIVLMLSQGGAYLYAGPPEGAPLVFDEPAGVRYFWLRKDYAPVRRTDAFKKAARDFGLVEYWRARGWPEMCHPVGADDFECS